MRVNRIKLITEMARQDMGTKRLAELSGVSSSAISAMRSGKSCRRNTAICVARALNVEIKDLEA